MYQSQRYQSREDELQNLEVDLDEHLHMKVPTIGASSVGGTSSSTTTIGWHSASGAVAPPLDAPMPLDGFLTLGVDADEDEDPESLFNA